MNKFLSLVIAAMFATASFGSFAASHGGAPKDGKKMEEKMDCSKTDKMDDKAKAECKKMMEKK